MQLVRTLDDKKKYTIKETAEWLGLSPAGIRRMILGGEIHAEVVGNVFRFSGNEIRRVASTNSQGDVE